MKTIALIAQKGGVGKTTIAVNLAVAAGIPTVLFDLDQQESAVVWADRRKSESPHVEFLTERRLADGLKAAAQGNYGLAILDTPPAAGPQAFTAAQVLGGHPKSGQWWSPQNRPIESSQDKGSYSASAGVRATIIFGEFCFFCVAMAN